MFSLLALYIAVAGSYGQHDAAVNPHQGLVVPDKDGNMVSIPQYQNGRGMNRKQKFLQAKGQHTQEGISPSAISNPAPIRPVYRGQRPSNNFGAIGEDGEDSE